MANQIYIKYEYSAIRIWILKKNDNNKFKAIEYKNYLFVFYLPLYTDTSPLTREV